MNRPTRSQRPSRGCERSALGSVPAPLRETYEIIVSRLHDALALDRPQSRAGMERLRRCVASTGHHWTVTRVKMALGVDARRLLDGNWWPPHDSSHQEHAWEVFSRSFFGQSRRS